MNIGKIDNDAFSGYVFKPQTIKSQIKVELVGDNFTELRGEIAGPPDTPYEGILSVSLHYNDRKKYVPILSFVVLIIQFISKVADIILK